MSALFEVDDGKLGLNFHSGQVKAWESRRRFVAVLAGTQGGKTSWGPWWLWREILDRGPGDYLAVTSSYDLFKLKMLPALREVFEHVMRSGRYWSGDRIIELADPQNGKFLASRADDPMWRRIILRSAESDSGLESSTAQAAWLDEAGQRQFTVEKWEAVLRRLSLSQGRVLLTTTVYSLGWLKTHVYDRWKKGDPDFEVVQFDSTENPAFPLEEAERARRTMPAWRYNMQYRGMFTRPAGQIYDCFDPEKQVVQRFPIPANWPRYLGLDFGGVNTAGIFLAAEMDGNRPTGRYFAYREYKAGGRSAVDHCYHLMQNEPRLRLAAGGSKSEGQWRMEFARGGMHLGRRVDGIQLHPPAVADVEVGIDRVYAMHAAGRILVFGDLAGYLGQKASYSREVDNAGEPTERIADKETYHFMDAERYIVGHLNKGETGGRPMTGAVVARAGPRI